MRSVVSNPLKHFGGSVVALTRCLVPLQAPAGFEALQHYSEQSSSHYDQANREFDETRLLESLSEVPCPSGQGGLSTCPVPPEARIAQLGKMLSEAAANYEASPEAQVGRNIPAGFLGGESGYDTSSTPPAGSLQSPSCSTWSTPTDARSPPGSPNLRMHPYAFRPARHQHSQVSRSFLINQLMINESTQPTHGHGQQQMNPRASQQHDFNYHHGSAHWQHESLAPNIQPTYGIDQRQMDPRASQQHDSNHCHGSAHWQHESLAPNTQPTYGIDQRQMDPRASQPGSQGLRRERTVEHDSNCYHASAHWQHESLAPNTQPTYGIDQQQMDPRASQPGSQRLQLHRERTVEHDSDCYHGSAHWRHESLAPNTQPTYGINQRQMDPRASQPGSQGLHRERTVEADSNCYHASAHWQHGSGTQLLPEVSLNTSLQRPNDRRFDQASVGSKLSSPHNFLDEQQVPVSNQQSVASNENNQQSPYFPSHDHYKEETSVAEMFSCIRSAQKTLGEWFDDGQSQVSNSQYELSSYSDQQSSPDEQQQWLGEPQYITSLQQDLTAAGSSGDTSHCLPSVSNDQQSPNVVVDNHPLSAPQQRMMSGQELGTSVGCEEVSAKAVRLRMAEQMLVDYIISLKHNRELTALGNLFSRRFDPSEHKGASVDDSDAGLMLALFGCVLSGQPHGVWLSYAFAMTNGIPPVKALLIKDPQGPALPRFLSASAPARMLLQAALKFMPNQSEALKLYFELVGRMYLVWKKKPFKPLASEGPLISLPGAIQWVRSSFVGVDIPKMYGDWLRNFPVVSLADYESYVKKYLNQLTPQQQEFKYLMSAVFSMLSDAPEMRNEAYLRFVELRFGRDIMKKLCNGLSFQAFELLLSHKYIDVRQLMSILDQRMPWEARKPILLGLLLSANVFVLAMGPDLGVS